MSASQPEDSPAKAANYSNDVRAIVRKFWAEAGYTQELLNGIALMAGNNRRGEGPRFAATSRKGSAVYDLLFKVNQSDTVLCDKLMAELAVAAGHPSRRTAIALIHTLVFGND